MADIRCSHCGKDNPDFFDVCQFCQSPLTPESMVHIGEDPVEKDTGELEEVLPDWLKDARQRGKNEDGIDDAFRSQTQPRVPKEEPPDLLAGLMSQADSDEDDVPDWLTSINPITDKKIPKATPTPEEEPSDFFSQFRQTEASPSVPAASEAAQEDMPAWMGMDETDAGTEQKDALTDFFSQTPAEPISPAVFGEAGDSMSQDDSWLKDLGSFDASEEKPQAEKEPEDLSWLHDLETASKSADELSSQSTVDDGFTFAPSSSPDEDLNWLDNLGGVPAPTAEEISPSQPTSSEEDLNWLDNLGDVSSPTAEEVSPLQSASTDDDLSWLDNLGGVSASSIEEPSPLQSPLSSNEDLDWLKELGGTPIQPSEDTFPSQPASSEDDLSWLSTLEDKASIPLQEEVSSQSSSEQEDMDWMINLASATEAATDESVQPQPSTSQDDLDWLSQLGETSEPSDMSLPSFAEEDEQTQPLATPSSTPKPFRTAPLRELAGEEQQDTTPDWLKDAMQEPSMPPPGAVSMDWFSEHSKPSEADEPVGPTQEEPASSQSAFDFSLNDSSSTSAEDVDELFKVEMPDWLSQEPAGEEISQQSASISASESDALAPVELPSWVQAMRPVDSAIDDAAAGSSSADQIIESEGPLAGFRGVIPASPIGSSLRPKAFSLKLQVTEEQQAGANLLEQIIANETLIQPTKIAVGVSSQRLLRWILSGLFLIVLSTVLLLGLGTMPIHASATVNELSNLVATIPEGSPVLVVIDYDPSFSGELEVAAGPLLDQLAWSRRSTFVFVSMSPNGSALVDRLMFNAGISKPMGENSRGLSYQLGEQYFNLGFLPGGSSGVLGFIENPAEDFARFEAIILMTDNAETGRVWVEQLETARPDVDGKPLLMVSSAQSGPMLQPYVSSGQVDIMISGLYDAAKYEFVNNTHPGTARAYWDAFGFGIMMAVLAIVLGSVWSVVMRIRERRLETEQV